MASVQLTETAAASVATPSSGKDQLFVDSAEGAVKAKNAAGNSRIVDNTAYRTLHEASGRLANDAAGAPTTYSFTQGGAMLASAANHASPLWTPTFYVASADLGTGAKLRITGELDLSATAPGTITFTLGLHAVTIAGGTDIMTYTLAAATSGTTSTVVNPSSSTANRFTGSDVAISGVTDGHYCLGLTLSAALANNLAGSVTARIQTRNT